LPAHKYRLSSLEAVLEKMSGTEPAICTPTTARSGQ
jgi:hypothetical protein